MLYVAYYGGWCDENWVACKHKQCKWAQSEDDDRVLVKYSHCKQCGNPLPVYSDKEMFKEMIEPRQSFKINDQHNAIVIPNMNEDRDLWIYFDPKTNEFLEMRIES